MTDLVDDAARSAAAILAPELGSNLPAEVEAVLYTRERGDQRPGQYDRSPSPASPPGQPA